MKKLFVLLMMTFALIGAGCKKNKDSKPVCYLTVITTDRGGVINLYYNEQGKLNKMMVSDRQTTYEYKADSVIATLTRNNMFLMRVIYKLNAQGLPILIRKEHSISGSQWLQYDYQYNGTEVVKVVITDYGNSAPETYEYTWSNGNLVKVIEGTNERKFEYYTDKLRTQGDGFDVELMSSFSGSIEMFSLYGAIEIVRNKNLLKKMEHTMLNVGSYSITFDYDFGEDGKIEKARMQNSNNNYSILLDYQYHCN